MTYRINYNGKYEDSITISADTIEELREIAHSECNRRGWNEDNCWSEGVDNT